MPTNIAKWLERNIFSTSHNNHKRRPGLEWITGLITIDVGTFWVLYMYRFTPLSLRRHTTQEGEDKA